MPLNNWPRLREGQVVELPEDGSRWRVLKVTASSATVRCLTTTKVEVKDSAGVVIADFDRPGKKTEWSPRAAVKVITEGEE